MRILHTADWHLGKIVNEFSMLALQEEYLKQLVETVDEYDVDAVLMAGDLYDRAIPPKEAVSLANEIFTILTQQLKVPVLVIAGNHDSNERVEYGSALLASSNLHIEGTTKEKIRKVTIDNVNIYLLPYDDHRNIRQVLGEEAIRTPEEALRAQLATIEADWDEDSVNILMYHGFVINTQSGETLEESDSERPLSIGAVDFVSHELMDAFDYVALGHLHKAQRVSSEKIRYSGSPLKYSKSEANHKKQQLLIDITKDHLEVTPIEIKVSKDLRVIKGTFSEIMEEASEDFVFFELEDTGYIVDAMNKLRRNYPYAMGLEYVNQKQHDRIEVYHSKENLKNTDPIALFGDFYEQTIGLPLNDDQKEAVAETFQQVKAEEEAK